MAGPQESCCSAIGRSQGAVWILAQWTWGLPIDTIELQSTLLDAGHPKHDLV